MLLEPVETLKLLQRKDNFRNFATGEIIFAEGEKAKLMYGIVAGEISISVAGKIVETIKAGDVFGIGAMLHPDHIRTSTATAKTECQIVSFDREHFLFAVQETPLFALEVMKSFSDRIRHLRLKIKEDG
jgi:CRP-like cAMP-binding protein